MAKKNSSEKTREEEELAQLDAMMGNAFGAAEGMDDVQADESSADAQGEPTTNDEPEQEVDAEQTTQEEPI
jgi:hypothetical protein